MESPDTSFPTSPAARNGFPDRSTPAVLDRYFQGALGEEEQAAIERWIAAEPERRRWVTQMGGVTAVAVTAMPADQAHAWAERVIARANTQGDVSRIGHASNRKASSAGYGRVGNGVDVGRQHLRGGKFVASGVILLMISALFLKLPYARTTISSHPHAIGRSYTTGTGQCATLALTDGSRVILAPQSHLDVVTGFGTTSRVVRLQGEAYFEVANADRPFAVQTGHITTQVLGTSFDIAHDIANRSVRVTVIHGKVTTRGLHGGVTLVANMTARVTDSSVTTAVEENPKAVIEWTTGRLVFHGAPASDVLAAVSRWYGVTFKIENPAIRTQILTAALDTRWSRSGVLAALESVLAVRMTAIGDTITLTSTRGLPGTFAPEWPRHESAHESFSPLQAAGR